ncbi:MAG: cell division protein FtsQ/DivIB [Chitinophagaceae bacterium]
MESVLEQNTWVRDAEVFLDNNAVLRIVIKERIPVARIFTVNGNSFYIDSSGKHLPLSSRLAVKLPVYTNFPADKETLYGADSALMEQIKKMSPFIMENPFWMAQVGQIDITPDRTFEMMPVVGKHLIQFGDGTDYEAKFHRLFLFYQQVGAKAGLDKYAAINVQFDNQVVATRKGPAGKIDSIQAIKNIQKLIESSRQMANDTVSTMVDNNIAASETATPPLTILNNNRGSGTVKDSVNHASSVARATTVRKPPAKPAAQKPKAVMGKPVHH